MLTLALTFPAFAGQMPTVSSPKGQMPTPLDKPASTATVLHTTGNNETPTFDLLAEVALSLAQDALCLF